MSLSRGGPAPPLDGHVALVTGSTRGIGWATAQRLAQQGATVVINGVSDTALLEQRVSELSRSTGRQMHGLLFDVADDTQVVAALREIHARYKRLDVLVNNAGILRDAMLGMFARDAVDRVLDVNVKGAIYVLQAAARLMMRAKRGSIINLSSIIGTRGNVGQALYAASKAALVGLTLAAAKELAPHGIRVNAIAPGYIDTDMIKHLAPDKHQERVAGIGMGRVGTPEDVADVAVFLASDGSRYVTGQVIGVDGGNVDLTAFLRRPASPQIALIEADTGETLTYADLEGALVDAGRQLSLGQPSLGQPPAPEKSLVFLFCRNSLSAVLLYLAAIEQGHAVALLDADLDVALQFQLLERYRPRFAWFPEGSPLPDLSHPALRADVSRWRDGQCLRFEVGGGAIHPDLALLSSTSGTTGSPRFVRSSRRAVEANAAAIAGALGLSTKDRAISSLPIFYAYGLSVLHSHLQAGASVVLSNAGAVERRFWDTIRAHECSSFAGVPYTYQMLSRLGFENFDVPSLRVLTQAGGRLEPELVRRFHALMSARGGRMFVMYGQTEAVARIAILPSDRLPEKLGSVGLALPGGELRIDAEAAPLGSPPGVGEVVYRGPNVMLGYADGAADLARGDELGGELRTGDLGYLDSDGMLFITGRIKRMGKLFGLRVNLDDVENLVRERGPAAVIEGKERLLVFCAFGDASLLDGLQRELAARLRVHRSGFEFRRVSELPTLASGKVDYQRLSL